MLPSIVIIIAYILCFKLGEAAGKDAAQKPRIINLDELTEPMTLWLEDKGIDEIIPAAFDGNINGHLFFEAAGRGTVEVLMSEYNERWRPWNLKPSAEQAKAEEWEEAA